jgi:hypothetical protein
MTIFAVIPQTEQGSQGTLTDGVRKGFPAAHYDLGHGAWLVSGQGTAQDISTQIGVTDGAMGTAVIVEIGSYYGRANPAIWTWIKTNWGGQPSG